MQLRTNVKCPYCGYEQTLDFYEPFGQSIVSCGRIGGDCQGLTFAVRWETEVTAKVYEIGKDGNRMAGKRAKGKS